MWTDSSPSSSENPTPPLGPPIEVQPSPVKGKRRRNPSTPPRNSPPTSVEAAGGFTAGHRRRPSGPVSAIEMDREHAFTFQTQVKTPRILNLLQESRPGDDEVKSEAAFQRLIASGSDLPLQPRTPRAASDRGRFPEEAGHEEIHREDTPSDDESHGEDAFAFLQSSEALTTKPCTPAGSVCGDELGMLISESPGPFQPMDIDMVSKLVLLHVRLNSCVCHSPWPRLPFHIHLLSSGGIRHHPLRVPSGRTNENVSLSALHETSS